MSEEQNTQPDEEKVIFKAIIKDNQIHCELGTGNKMLLCTALYEINQLIDACMIQMKINEMKKEKESSIITGMTEREYATSVLSRVRK